MFLLPILIISLVQFKLLGKKISIKLEMEMPQCLSSSEQFIAFKSNLISEIIYEELHF